MVNSVVKGIFKVLAIILAVIIGLIALVYIGQYPLMALNSKQIYKGLPINKTRIDYRDYKFDSYSYIDSWYESFYYDESSRSLDCLDVEYGWSLRNVNTRIRDNVFSEDYFIYNDNTDILLCTDESVYVKKDVSFPDSPLLNTVNGVTVKYSVDVVGEGYKLKCKKVNLTSSEAYRLLEIVCDENYLGTFDSLTGGKYITDGYYEKTFELLFDYSQLDTINCEGVVWNAGERIEFGYDSHFHLALDSACNMYLVLNGKVKPLPHDLAEKLLEVIQSAF